MSDFPDLPHADLRNLKPGERREIVNAGIPRKTAIRQLYHYAGTWDGCPSGCWSAYAEVRWGIQHGIKNCIHCGYPFRLYHWIAGTIRVVRFLPVHPDFVTRP